MTDIDEPIPAPLSLLERLKRMQKRNLQEREPPPFMPRASAAQVLARLKAKKLFKRDMIWL